MKTKIKKLSFAGGQSIAVAGVQNPGQGLLQIEGNYPAYLQGLISNGGLGSLFGPFPNSEQQSPGAGQSIAGRAGHTQNLNKKLVVLFKKRYYYLPPMKYKTKCLLTLYKRS